MPGERRIETDTPTWRTIVDWAEERKSRSRAILEAPGVPERDADLQRGCIAVLDELIKLPLPRPGRTIPQDGRPGTED